MQALIERLPRRLVPLALKPLAQIKPLERIGQYLSLGNTPTFELVPGAPLEPGWYYLEAALLRHNGGRQASLRGEDAESQAVVEIPVPSNLRGTVREVFWLPAGCTRVLWQPTTARGVFGQSPLVLHRISAIESGLRRAYRVALDWWRFRKTSRRSLGALSPFGALRNLSTAYAASAARRLQHVDGFDEQQLIAHSNVAVATACTRAAAAREIRSIALLVPLDGCDQATLPALTRALRAALLALAPRCRSAAGRCYRCAGGGSEA